MAKRAIIKPKVKKERKQLSRLAVKSIDHRFIGDEPVDITDKDYSKVLSWYSYSCDEEQARTWLLEYLKRERTKEEYKAVQKAPKWAIPNTIGWQSRIMLNGNKLSESSLEFFNQKLREIMNAKLDPEEDEVSVVVKATPNIRERTVRKSDELLAEAESEVIDERSSMYEFLVKKEATAQAAKYMLAFYQKIYDEVMSSDDAIKEAYGKRLASERKFWSTVIDDLNRYLGNKKATKVRKPRTIKVKPLTDVLKNFQYQKDFPQLKIVSVNPVEIVGAHQVWLFNTKYNKLTKLQSSGPNGLQVKGTTIIGVDVENSLTKRCRKPDIIIQQLLSAGKITLRKLMDDINSIKQEPATRTNDATVILRVIK